MMNSRLGKAFASGALSLALVFGIAPTLSTENAFGEESGAQLQDATNQFSDVYSNTDHLTDITWLAKEGITVGWAVSGGQEFRPYWDVARADFVTFLYRWMGCPEITNAEVQAAKNALTDVNDGTAHQMEIYWAYTKGITKGFADGTFRPNDSIARCDAAAMLCRIAGVEDTFVPTEDTKQIFSDVILPSEETDEGTDSDGSDTEEEGADEGGDQTDSSSSLSTETEDGSKVSAEMTADADEETPHHNAVLWMAEKGISQGWPGEGDGGKALFKPYDTIKRCDMAAFMNRANSNVELSMKEDTNLFLGSFFVDEAGSPGFSTVLCTSKNGISFEKISTPFKNSSVDNPFHDPSIMYKDGYFWLLSNWNRQNGKFWPMFSYSKDLVNWTQPEGFQLINGGTYQGISLESYPNGNANFDNVAPEWFLDDNGDCYILFSAGWYGDFHGDPGNDRMINYIVKVDISASEPNSKNSASGKWWPNNLRVNAGTAFQVKGIDSSENYIDSSMYKENGKYYFCTKKNGVTNQIYENSSVSATGWRKVNDNIAVGNEGPCLTKCGMNYIMYTDKINTLYGNTDNGMTISTSTSITGSFGTPSDLYCADVNGNKIKLRHGTVINVGKIGGAAKTATEALRTQAGF